MSNISFTFKASGRKSTSNSNSSTIKSGVSSYYVEGTVTAPDIATAVQVAFTEIDKASGQPDRFSITKVRGK